MLTNFPPLHYLCFLLQALLRDGCWTSGVDTLCCFIFQFLVVFPYIMGTLLHSLSTLWTNCPLSFLCPSRPLSCCPGGAHPCSPLHGWSLLDPGCGESSALPSWLLLSANLRVWQSSELGLPLVPRLSFTCIALKTVRIDQCSIYFSGSGHSYQFCASCQPLKTNSSTSLLTPCPIGRYRVLLTLRPPQLVHVFSHGHCLLGCG